MVLPDAEPPTTLAVLVHLDGGISMASLPLSGALQMHVTRDPGSSDAEAVVTHIVRLVEEVRGKGRCVGLGVATPGLVTADGRIPFAPNLNFRNVPLRDLLMEALGGMEVTRE